MSQYQQQSNDISEHLQNLAEMCETEELFPIRQSTRGRSQSLISGLIPDMCPMDVTIQNHHAARPIRQRANSLNKSEVNLKSILANEFQKTLLSEYNPHDFSESKDNEQFARMGKLVHTLKSQKNKSSTSRNSVFNPRQAKPGAIVKPSMFRTKSLEEGDEIVFEVDEVKTSSGYGSAPNSPDQERERLGHGFHRKITFEQMRML